MSVSARSDLTDHTGGRWLVTTISGSVYVFDLDAKVVERVGGDDRPVAAPSDTLQSLRGIIEVRVGARGRWWIRNADGGYVDPDEVWQWSSRIDGIESVAAEELEAGQP